MHYERREIIGGSTLYLADCMALLPHLPEHSACIVDPPYGVTSLKWDKRLDGWAQLIPSRSLWCFGSMRFFMEQEFPGWTYCQELIWEKHNGSNFHADRFRRVHELAVHFYRGDWASLYKAPVFTPDATKPTVRRKKRPTHNGHIEAGAYTSEDGGPRMMRSVIYARSCHGYAQHPTQKPLEIIEPLIEYSCPPNGTVLDPFMGSGSTGVACVKQGRAFTGIEVNSAYFEIACERIAEAYEAQTPGPLFADAAD